MPRCSRLDRGTPLRARRSGRAGERARPIAGRSGSERRRTRSAWKSTPSTARRYPSSARPRQWSIAFDSESTPVSTWRSRGFTGPGEPARPIRWRSFKTLATPGSGRFRGPFSKPWSPMAREVRNVAASVRARFRSVAREYRANFQRALTRHALERQPTRKVPAAGMASRDPTVLFLPGPKRGRIDTNALAWRPTEGFTAEE